MDDVIDQSSEIEQASEAAPAPASTADTIGTATYSPEDNKLRIYPFARLDPDVYARVRAAGFIWAPKQELFVAPAWTPGRADLAVRLCGEIGDEDQTLVERAEQRAERFEEYHENRTADAQQAQSAVSAIADGIPLGQPILVGHHSERRARKDAQRIEDGMRRAIKLWDTAEYWTQRAAGAIRHAKYKERPDVRARRIKGIESDRRKQERAKADAARHVAMFARVDQDDVWKVRDDGTIPTRQERAYFIAGRMSGGPYMAQVKLEGPNATTLHYCAYDVLAPDDKRYAHCPAMTVDDVIAKLHRWRDQVDAYADRWIAHFDHRLAYERAMLAEAGGLITDRSEYPIVPGGRVLVRGEWSTVIRVNRKDGKICSVTTAGKYGAVRTIEQVKEYQPPTAEAAAVVKGAIAPPPIVNEDVPGALHMTKAEFVDRKRHSDAYGYDRVKAAGEFAAYRQAGGFRGGLPITIFFTDQPVKLRPRAAEAVERPTLPPVERVIAEPTTYTPRVDPAAGLRETLRAGVQVVSAPQLFPTPPEVARRVFELADIQPGECVLEPSAGTGNLIAPVVEAVDTEILAYEINGDLCAQLRRQFPSYRVQVRQADFLTVTDHLGCYPKIVMNPPFANGADIKHIEHARQFLAPGGRLVAVCAAGPRQRAAFAGETWIDLPAGSFKDQGTGVNAAIVVIERGR